MARPVVLTKALTAASATAVCASQTLAAAGNLTINGSAASGGVATLDTQRRVLITSAGNDSGITFTVYGTNDNGGVIRQTITGGNAAGVATGLDFYTITRIYASGATAAGVTVGTNTVGSSRWVLFDPHLTAPNLGLGLELVSGSGETSGEYTMDEVMLPSINPTVNLQGSDTAVPVVNAISGLSNQTANAQSDLTQQIRAWRLTVNSGTGAWKLTGIQGGII